MLTKILYWIQSEIFIRRYYSNGNLENKSLF